MRNAEDTERLTAFIESLKVSQTPFLMKLEQQALQEQIPIIRPQTRALIRFLLDTGRPRRILEVGTAIGYSTLYMREYAPADCEIVSIEKDPEREKRAEQNVHAYAAETKAQRGGRTEDGLEKAGGDGGAAAEKSKEADGGGTPGAGLTGGGGAEQGEGPDCRITLIEGDAADVLKNLAEQDGRRFDFVFMDAAKGQYIHFLPMVKALLAPGGVLLSDNVLKGGEILEPRYAVTRRNRTIHRRMREYLEALTSDPELSTVVLATGDGAAMSVRRIPVEDGSFHGPIREQFRTGISSADDV
jgi:predicted O-methyltransferase YrrM